MRVKCVAEEHKYLTQYPPPQQGLNLAQGGYSSLLMTGMIEGLFGFEIFDSGIFLGWKIWQVFFWVTWFKLGIFLGIKNELKCLGMALAYLWYDE